MTLPQNVADAVKSVRKHFDLSMDDATCEAWQTIRAHLMSQEAEIELLSVAAEQNMSDAKLAESRLAAANALLRELLGAKWCTHEYVDVCNRSATHLQGAGDEA